MAFTGIRDALKKAPVTDSPLFVFTDAPPKDVSLLKKATVEAKSYGAAVYFFLTNGCGNEADYLAFEELPGTLVVRFLSCQNQGLRSQR